MTGLFRTLLIDHFSHEDNLEPPYDAKLFTYDTDTGILIEDALVWRPVLTEKRPAVIIKRNEWNSIKAGIGNVSGVTAEGHKQYTKFWKGSHTIFCIAREGAEVEKLCAEVYRYMLHFGQIYRHYLDLLMFELLHVGPVGRVEEMKDHYMVPVSVGYAWAETWILRNTAPAIKSVTLGTNYSIGLS
jgi:hypothetical protein